MAKKSDPPAPAVPAPAAPVPVASVPSPISESGSANAPFIYFEGAPTFGHMNGIIRITLEATRIYPGPSEGTVAAERVLVAHLRMNIPAARALRKAVDGALLLATPPETQSKN